MLVRYQIGDGIALIHGLNDCMAGELVEFSNGVLGLAQNLEESNVGVVILDHILKLLKATKLDVLDVLWKFQLGKNLLVVVNPLGQPIDGQGPINTTKTRPVEQKLQV